MPNEKSKSEEENEIEELDYNDGDNNEVGTTNDKINQIVKKLKGIERERYGAFKSSKFTKSSIKKIMGKATDSPLGEDLVIAMKSIAKVFVGELVETAREIQTENGDSGPIKPNFYKMAWERLAQQRKLPISLLQDKKKLFTK